jgi:hypothetical protein
MSRCDLPTTSTQSKALAVELVQFLKKNIKNTKIRSEWSAQNFRLLRKFARMKGAGGYPTSDPRNSKKRKALFLWDFVAYGGKGLLFVAESEWEKKDAGLKHDFEKLLYVRSPVKLFMCRMKTGQEPAEVKAKLLRYMRSVCSYYSAGEVFILYFVWWSITDGKNRDVAYYLQIPGESEHVEVGRNQDFKRIDF